MCFVKVNVVYGCSIASVEADNQIFRTTGLVFIVSLALDKVRMKVYFWLGIHENMISVRFVSTTARNPNIENRNKCCIFLDNYLLLYLLQIFTFFVYNFSWEDP